MRTRHRRRLHIADNKRFARRLSAASRFFIFNIRAVPTVIYASNFAAGHAAQLLQPANMVLMLVAYQHRVNVGRL